jgi:hypothetical protein
MASFYPHNLSGMNGVGDFLQSGAETLVPRLVEKVEFYTAISKPSTLITGQSLVDDAFGKGKEKDTLSPAEPPPPGGGALFLKALAPTFELTSPIIGTKYYAPYGRAGRNAYKLGKLKLYGGIVITLVGLLGVGFAFGYNRGKKLR